MDIPAQAKYVIIGAGIHGLSSAWHLAAAGERGVVVLDKNGVGAGASGIACGVVRNNYFQPAMRELMAHSVEVWESDPRAFSYHSVGYMQISPESMRGDVAQIYAEQKAIGYESELTEGAGACDAYMKRLFSDWQARGVVSVLHEKRGGYANNLASLKGLAAKAEAAGASVISGVAVCGLEKDAGGAVRAVQTDRGRIECEQVIIAAGPWVKSFWDMLELPKTIAGGVPMWRYWALQEGVLKVPPDFLQTEDGAPPPVIHIDSNEPLADAGGKLITDEMWGIYYKPDFHFNGVQGGAAPFEVRRAADEVEVDPYGPESPEFVVGGEFARMWCAALAFCHKRFEGKQALFHDEPSGGLGCFTPDSFPVFDRFCENAYIIADSNHGYKMLGVGKLVAEELRGTKSALLEPFRFARYAAGKTHPTSNSPFPWS
ncbi:MAG: NAD(P)/FAD-dependent oxidoreductase [Gammaproteobacteria bacterium]